MDPTMKSYRYAGTIDDPNANPAMSSPNEESNSSISTQTHPQFPSTVVLDHNMNCYQGQDGANTNNGSSNGTGPTFIGTSPLSEEPYEYQYSDTELELGGGEHHNIPQHSNRFCNSSQYGSEKITVKTKNKSKRKVSHQHQQQRSDNYYDKSGGVNANDGTNIIDHSMKNSSFWHSETISRRKDPYRNPIDANNEHRRHQHHDHGHGQHGSAAVSNHHHDTLSWRMDPSISLSDFTLTVIGVDDKIAIERYHTAKKKKKKDKSSKRRDKWMVEGLYLDLSRSMEDDDRQDDGHHRDNSDDRYHGHEHDQEYRNDTIHLVHSTISGTKSSKYPVVGKYHLHKVNLAVGLKSCDYFARLFQKKNTSSSSRSSSCNSHSIEIPLSCLPALQDMLDHLYDPDQSAPVHATTATAIPLRHLGKLLGNQSLFDSATQFLHMDLRPETAIEYLQHAELYQQKKLAEVCIRICADSFDQLKITWCASLGPRLMEKILYSRYFTSAINSRALCTKVASYCRCQMHKIDREMLLSLTNVKVMPVVSPEEALFFIQMMVRLGMDVEDNNNGNVHHHISAEERILYERCIAAAPKIVPGVIDSLCQGDNHNEVDNNNELSDVGRRKANRQSKAACSDYSSLPPQIKVDLLEYALAKQQT